MAKADIEPLTLSVGIESVKRDCIGSDEKGPAAATNEDQAVHSGPDLRPATADRDASTRMLAQSLVATDFPNPKWPELLAPS
jgi:hypothetical protein